MRIVWDVSIQSAPYLTGVERVQRNLLRELTRFDFTNEYFLIAKSHVKFNFDLPDNYTVIDISSKRPTYLWREQLIPPIIKKFKADLLHSPVSAIPILGACKKIATIHELPWVERRRGVETIKKQHKVWLFLNTRFADSIVAVSNRTRRNILSLYPESAPKIKVIHHGIAPIFEPVEMLPDPEEFLWQYEIPVAPFVFFVGSLRRKKNLSMLLDAFEDLVNEGAPLNLVMAGIRNTAYPDLKERMDHGVLKSRVFLTGYLNDRDLNFFYNMAEIMVYPSMFEGFGLPPLEAMACGTPVVTTTGGAIPDVVGDAAITVDPMDKDGMAQAIGQIHSDPKFGAEYVRRGFERVKLFTWRKAAEAYLDHYRSLLQ